MQSWTPEVDAIRPLSAEVARASCGRLSLDVPLRSLRLAVGDRVRVQVAEDCQILSKSGMFLARGAAFHHCESSDTSIVSCGGLLFVLPGKLPQSTLNIAVSRCPRRKKR
jgi:hypothetical protein